MEKAVERSMTPRSTRLAKLHLAQEYIRRATTEMATIVENVHDDGVRITRSFVRLSRPRTRPQPAAEGGPPPRVARLEDLRTRPPCTRLVGRHSNALPLYLIMLCAAQGDYPPGARVPPGGGRPYWPATTGSYSSLMGLRHLDRRNRTLHLNRALLELYGAGLIELPAAGSRSRYANFELRSDEGGGGAYRPPSPTRGDQLKVPLEFFSNGWHLVLKPTEIANLLMLIDRMQLPGVSRILDRVGAREEDRWGTYGVTTEVYETHRELAEFGLVELHDVVPGRRLGKVAGEQQFLECFYFSLLPNGFRRNAVDVVLNAMTSSAARPYLLRE